MVATDVALTAVAAALGGLIGLAMLRASYTRLRRARRTEGTESKPTGDLSPADDRVSVTGTVADPEGTRTAHLLDREAPVVETEAGRFNERANVDAGPDETDPELETTGGSYDYRQRAVRAAPFELRDDTGSVRVEADDETTDAVLDAEDHLDVRNADDPREPIAAAVAASDDLLLGSQTDRLREAVAAVGDEVTVQGVPTGDGGDLALVAGDAGLLVADGDPEAAADAQAEGWLGYLLLGLLFAGGSGYLAFLLLLA